MEGILAECGNRCDLCPAYHRNIKKFDKQKIAEGWMEYFGSLPSLDEIKCMGCLNEGQHPRGNCLIKNCVHDKNLENCGHCPDLISNSEFCFLLKKDMDIKEESLKEHENISKEDYDIFFRAYENKPILMEIHRNLNKKK